MRDPREMDKRGKTERPWEPEPLHLPLHVPPLPLHRRLPDQDEPAQEDSGAKSSVIVIDLL